MNKQKLSLSLGLVTVLLSSFVGTAALAGSGPAKGTGTGSGSFIGTPSPSSGASNANVSVSANGKVSVTVAVQTQVNNIAKGIISRPAPANSPLNIVLIILRGGPSAGASISRVQTVLINVRVSSGSVQALTRALAAIFGSGRAQATSGVPVAELEASQLVASNKDLAASKIAQTEETPQVDINQLNASINAYNKIILESSPETLQELAKNEEFVAIGNVLKELRSALNK
jgi:uncharacterized membrane protein (UPF0182 family)